MEYNHSQSGRFGALSGAVLASWVLAITIVIEFGCDDIRLFESSVWELVEG